MEKWTQISASITVLMMMAVLCVTNARDPGPLQDFCIGINDTQSAITVNGLFCKNPNDVTANDFVFQGLTIPGNTSNILGSAVQQANADTFPALNTQGMSITRVDLAPFGTIVPHVHPRSSEMVYVVEGTIYVGFVTSNLQSGGNRLYARVIRTGELFLIPQGLVHFQQNVENRPAFALNVFGSQNPGIVPIANAVFGSTPPISPEVLTRAFQLDFETVARLQATF